MDEPDQAMIWDDDTPGDIDQDAFLMNRSFDDSL
jgi:hypothetical protein